MGRVINTRQTYPCPCTSGLVFDDCCRPIMTGHKRAVTAEAVARTRHCAWVVRDEEYLLETWHPMTRPTRLKTDSGWFWYWFEIDQVVDGGPHDATAMITFTAYRRRAGIHVAITEEARYERHYGWWMYRDSVTMSTDPM